MTEHNQKTAKIAWDSSEAKGKSSQLYSAGNEGRKFLWGEKNRMKEALLASKPLNKKVSSRYACVQAGSLKQILALSWA